MKALMILSLVLLASCGKDGSQGTPGVTTVVEVPAPVVETPPVIPEVIDQEQVDIDNLVQDENDYRISQGQTMLSKGLSCSLQTFTGGDRIQASIAGHNTLQGLLNVGSYTLQTSINQPDTSSDLGLNVLPTSLKMTYKNNYLLRCTGYLVIAESGHQKFDLLSDDASILYIAGAKVVDNDNAHGVNLVTGTKLLRRGVVAIRLDYAQNGGSQALALKMNDEVLSSNKFLH